MTIQLPYHTRISFLKLGAILLLLFHISCDKTEPTKVIDNFEFAKLHQEDLQLSVYITAHSIHKYLSSDNGRREALSLMRANGMTKVYLEVYRGGFVADKDLLVLNTNYFNQNGIEVVGGIATVPGKDFGVRQEGQLGWFNWQNAKTQEDLKKVMLEMAPVFDTFIIDDFLCTADTSKESIEAKGERGWSEYRRELLTNLANSIFIEPARSVNPDINMIIKYPQSYDVYHKYGYDVETGPKLFDQVWVGTESRGQYTQRFGFVQPYEGFINYRWISSLSGDKIGAAWFDHGDCDQLDFIEQAYQSVIAGARELVIFNYGNFISGHPGHHLLRKNFDNLITLSTTIQDNPVVGIAGYKPPHSEAGGDLYIMDFIGMFGVPLVPHSSYPEKAHTVFLATQAAKDAQILTKIDKSLQQGSRIIMTSGFLATIENSRDLLKRAGISKPKIKKQKANKLIVADSIFKMNLPLDLEAEYQIKTATIELEAFVGHEKVPFLTQSEDGQIFVLNSHTFSQADFDAVGEFLLCPRPLGLVELPKSWANRLRQAFNHKLAYDLDAEARISMQTLSNGDVVLHNYRNEASTINLSGGNFQGFTDGLNGYKLKSNDQNLSLQLKPRSRVWIKK